MSDPSAPDDKNAVAGIAEKIPGVSNIANKISSSGISEKIPKSLLSKLTGPVIAVLVAIAAIFGLSVIIGDDDEGDNDSPTTTVVSDSTVPDSSGVTSSSDIPTSSSTPESTIVESTVPASSVDDSDASTTTSG